MAYPLTENGYNMFDLLSMLQKSIRRGEYEYAGFAAKQLKTMFRSVLWNRMIVISSEDCYGILTKELIALKEQDDVYKNDDVLSCAIALLCSAKKSRDACYFSCNFILDTREPRKIKVTDEEIVSMCERLSIVREEFGIIDKSKLKYDNFGFSQPSLFECDCKNVDDETYKELKAAVILQKALEHKDMDMIGSQMDILRKANRALLWSVFFDYAKEKMKVSIIPEIIALKKADDIVNKNKQPNKKDEIFISKTAMIICYEIDGFVLSANEIIDCNDLVDWSKYHIKSISDCILKGGKIPDFTFDCHTLKGKKEGKTDWDMTRTEQAALYPLNRAYFDDASWIYTYEQDWRNNAIPLYLIEEIRENAKTHPANPVEFIPYEGDELDGAEE